MKLIEKFKSNPKNLYYLIAAIAFVLINVIGLIWYQSKNSNKENIEVQSEEITEAPEEITPTDGPVPTDWPTATPEPKATNTPRPTATMTPTLTVTPTPTPTNTPAPTNTPTVTPTPTSTPTPTVTPMPTSVGTT